MRRKIWLLAMVGAVLLSGTAAGADDFYVIGARVAQGTNIIKLPLTINASGYYYLTGNLTYTGGDGITVDADNVTIDLMGFVLTGASTGDAGYWHIAWAISRTWRSGTAPSPVGTGLSMGVGRGNGPSASGQWTIRMASILLAQIA